MPPSSLWLARARRLRSALLDLIFPPRCLGCKRVGAWYCAQCISAIAYIHPPICSRCGQELAGAVTCAACRRSPLPAALDGLRAVAHHGGALRQAIHALKYERLSVIAEPLGLLLHNYLQQHSLPCTLIIPVPLHPERQHERGYNQSALLADVLCRHSGQPLNTQALIRQRHTRPQVGLDEKERRQNLRDAFQCVARLDQQQVLLIDDVCTTGSTLSECAQALRAAGAHAVWGLTLAR